MSPVPGHTILIAQSDHFLAARLNEILTQAGCTVPPVIAAPDGIPASVARHQPDLLLLDLDLPGVWDTSEFDIPTVYLAASPDHPALSGPLVLKPVHARELVAVIELALQRRAFLRHIQIQESELHTLIANVPGAVYRCEILPPWRFSHVSEYILAVTGRPAAEFLDGSVTWADLVLPEDLADVTQTVDAAVASRQPFDLEYRIVHLDGEPRWVQESGRCVDGADGLPSHLDGVILDITARKHAETILERKRAELQSVYEEAPVMLCVLDSDRRFLSANRAFTEFTGQPNDQLRAKQICEALGCQSGPDCPQCALCALLRDSSLTGAARRDVPLKLTLAPGGAPQVFHVRASTALIPAPGAPRLLLCLSDVTAQEQTRQALLVNDDKYRALVENASQAVVVAQDGLLRFVNSTAERLSGRSRAELTDTSFEELIHPGDRAFVMERYAARVHGQHVPSDYPFRLLTRGGGTCWVHLNVVPIEWDGHPATLNLLSDVTEQIRLEADYGTLFESMLDGFAVHELLLDPEGRPSDYRFLAVNPAFERLTGLAGDRVVGRTASEVLPILESYWLETYSQVVSTGASARFQNYSAQLDRWFEVYAFRPREGQFACIIQDITERKQFQDALVFLADCGYLKSGEGFFHSLARYLAENLKMDQIRVDRIMDDGLQARTIAAYCDGEFQDNFAYQLSGTPGGEAVGRNSCCYPSEVRRLFPNDEALRKMEAECYAGATLWSFDGKPVGLIAAIGRKPLANPRFIESVLELVAVRASSELERQQAESALRESEERHRSILNASPDGIVIADLEFRIRMASRQALTMFRVAGIDDVIGLHLREFMTPGDRERVISDLSLMLHEDTPKGPIEYRTVRTDGSVLDVEVNGETIRGADGQPASLVFVIRDVSQRKQAEAALRASEDQYRTLIHNLPSGVVVHGRDTQVLLANPMAANLLGLAEDQLHGKFAADPAWRFVREDGTPLPLDDYPVNQVISGRQAVRHVVIGVIRPGATEPILVGCNAYPVLDPEGCVCQVVVTLIDITERKLAAARLLHAQKMESVGRLAGGIAHDFNNLLTVINGYSMLMLDKINSLDPLQADVQAILKAGERAAALTGKILAFSRKQMLRLRVLDLNFAVEDLRSLLVRLVGEDVEIIVRLGAGPFFVNADPDQLAQVIMNVAVNARDAMPGGGKLVIETSGVEWNADLARQQPDLPAGRYLLLTITDTGSGMDQATRQRIFEPFFTTKDVGQGTGLGLSMVQGIVAQSGGFVDVRSELGCGSTFRIFLPRVDDPQALATPSADSPSTPRARGGDESILLVEDQLQVRHFAAHALQSYGYCVTSALDAVEALRMFQQAPDAFDLVLTDIVMPGLSGRELADRLHAIRPGLKVLFMSGYAGDALLRRGVREEDPAFIEKPFSPDQLASRVRALLESR